MVNHEVFLLDGTRKFLCRWYKPDQNLKKFLPFTIEDHLRIIDLRKEDKEEE